MYSSKSLVLIASALVAVSADYSCTLVPQQVEKPSREIHMNYANNYTYTGCHSLGESMYGSAEFDSSKMSLELYYDYGCAGDKKVREVSGAIHDDEHKHRSCRIVPKDIVVPPPAVEPETPILVAQNETAPAAAHPQCFFNKQDTAPPVAPQASQYAAVLYEGPEYTGIKHWIDGGIGECRGLSGVQVASVKNVAHAGADPEINPSLQTDAFTIAFYSDWGCTGTLLTSVTNDQPHLCDAMENTWTDSGCPSMGHEEPHVGNMSTTAAYGAPMTTTDATIAPLATNAAYGTSMNQTYGLYRRSLNMTEGTNATSATCFSPKSIKFILTGTPSKDYGASFDAKAVVPGSGASGFVQGVVGSLGVIGMTGLVNLLV